MSLYREWCQKPQWRKGLMVTDHALNVIKRDKDPGYMSVYMFDEDAAKQIEQQGNSRGMAFFEVYSDCVFIDIDKGWEPVEQAIKKLTAEGLAFQIYRSGGKGYHIVVPLTKIVQGKNVPYSQKKWVESLGIDFDPSIYKASGLISIVGRVHPKTGAKKEFYKAYPGNALELELLDPPEPQPFQLTADENLLRRGLIQLANLANNPPQAGNRHNSIWQVSKTLAEAGVQYDTALDLALNLNNSWENPKPAEAVKEAVQGAYHE